MCDASELGECPFRELCQDCHPEANMAEYRENCTNENCHSCGIYWAFHDGYHALDED